MATRDRPDLQLGSPIAPQLTLDHENEIGFVKFFRNLPDKDASTIRVFERSVLLESTELTQVVNIDILLCPRGRCRVCRSECLPHALHHKVPRQQRPETRAPQRHALSHRLLHVPTRCTHDPRSAHGNLDHRSAQQQELEVHQASLARFFCCQLR
jgi:hypothetical protein